MLFVSHVTISVTCIIALYCVLVFGENSRGTQALALPGLALVAAAWLKYSLERASAAGSAKGVFLKCSEAKWERGGLPRLAGAGMDLKVPFHLVAIAIILAAASSVALGILLWSR